jgi:hypothetical protein
MRASKCARAENVGGGYFPVRMATPPAKRALHATSDVAHEDEPAERDGVEAIRPTRDCAITGDPIDDPDTYYSTVMMTLEDGYADYLLQFQLMAKEIEVIEKECTVLKCIRDQILRCGEFLRAELVVPLRRVSPPRGMRPLCAIEYTVKIGCVREFVLLCLRDLPICLKWIKGIYARVQTQYQATRDARAYDSAADVADGMQGEFATMSRDIVESGSVAWAEYVKANKLFAIFPPDVKMFTTLRGGTRAAANNVAAEEPRLLPNSAGLFSELQVQRSPVAFEALCREHANLAVYVRRVRPLVQVLIKGRESLRALREEARSMETLVTDCICPFVEEIYTYPIPLGLPSSECECRPVTAHIIATDGGPVDIFQRVCMYWVALCRARVEHSIAAIGAYIAVAGERAGRTQPLPMRDALMPCPRALDVILTTPILLARDFPEYNNAARERMDAMGQAVMFAQTYDRSVRVESPPPEEIVSPSQLASFLHSIESTP